MGHQSHNEVDTDTLRAFADAFNRHDLDDVMSFMTDDTVFQSSSGPDVDGVRYEGREDVSTGLATFFDLFPDGRWGNDSHFVCGDRGVSQWTFTGTGKDGNYVEVDGCDIFTFKNGKISVKNSFRKNRIVS